MTRKNCWEILKCGLEPGGQNADKRGVCPAAIATALSGVNSGRNGGRVCWAVAGTMCNGEIQRSFEDKEFMCLDCAVFKKILKDEGLKQIRLFPKIQEYA
ncbi:MAG TPA: hypothetical protein VII00_06115 [bacterium]